MKMKNKKKKHGQEDMELRQVSRTFRTSGDSGRQGPQEAENCVLALIL